MTFIKSSLNVVDKSEKTSKPSETSNAASTDDITDKDKGEAQAIIEQHKTQGVENPKDADKRAKP